MSANTHAVDGVEVVRFNVFLPRELRRQLKQAAAERDVTMGEIVVAALERELRTATA